MFKNHLTGYNLYLKLEKLQNIHTKIENYFKKMKRRKKAQTNSKKKTKDVS